MVAKIEQDTRRFREIVRGNVRRNLRRHMSNGDLIGRQGDRMVSIPIPHIEIPRFKFGRRQSGGVGQGDGDKGTPIGADPHQPGGGDEAGNLPGDHILEVEVSLQELADILGEELELPNIEPRGQENIETRVDRYTGIRRVGPESLRHFKRTYREALKRQIAMGTYNFKSPTIIPVREDKRYRSWKSHYEPDSNAVIIYMMDVSGSMHDRKKEIVRLTAFWIDTWLRSQYQKVEVRYIIHDAAAREVDQQAFYHTRESGGTAISSAYLLCRDMIREQYPPTDWNVYPFHFSDGDNWRDDNVKCAHLLVKDLLPAANLFCYGEVGSSSSRSRFLRTLHRLDLEDPERLTVSRIGAKDEILDAIKNFLGKGR